MKKRRFLRQEILFSLLLLPLMLPAFGCDKGKQPGPITLGSAAPDFRCEDLEGRFRNLEEEKGRVVLLRFWADWCPYCRFEMPVIEKYYLMLREQGFQVLAVNVKQSSAVAEAFSVQLGVTFPVLLDPEGKVALKYKVHTIPTNFLIDRKGVIREILIGEVFRKEEVLDELLRGYFPQKLQSRNEHKEEQR